jgi:hypothetical protein
MTEFMDKKERSQLDATLAMLPKGEQRRAPAAAMQGARDLMRVFATAQRKR